MTAKPPTEELARVVLLVFHQELLNINQDVIALTNIVQSDDYQLVVLYCDTVKVWGGVQAGSIEIYFPSHQN